MAQAGITTRDMIRDFLDVGTGESSDIVLMGRGFTEANEEPGAQSDSKRYINDKSATGSVKSYEWKKPFTADLIEDEKAIAYIADIGRLCKTGADAESVNYNVELGKPVAEKAGTYYARQMKVAIIVNSFSDNDGEMQVEGEFAGIGDPVEGEFNITTKTFTAKDAVATP
ncbi:MAG: hypothetical protein PHT21_11570 [Lachnospiraceae bacterium]|nr:hypothetical protein [Lachnospiraceae bacterium]